MIAVAAILKTVYQYSAEYDVWISSLASMAMQATDSDAEGSEARFEEYCSEVEKSAAWGGQLELEALSRAYQRHITVYSVGMPPVEMGTDFGGRPFCC